MDITGQSSETYRFAVNMERSEYLSLISVADANSKTLEDTILYILSQYINVVNT